jgi:hypothetical protein
MSQTTELREAVRERYAAAALRSAGQQRDGGCCDPSPAGSCCGTGDADQGFGAALYAGEDAAEPALAASLAAACRPPSPTCAPARPSSTSAPAPAPTC